MKVKILRITPGVPLEINKAYKVNFETEEHYIIYNNDIWCGIYKNNVEVINEYYQLGDGQLVFIL